MASVRELVAVLGLLCVLPSPGCAAGGASAVQQHPLAPHDRCEPITIPMCMGIAYNQTIFPNLMGNR